MALNISASEPLLSSTTQHHAGALLQYTPLVSGLLDHLGRLALSQESVVRRTQELRNHIVRRFVWPETSDQYFPTLSVHSSVHVQSLPLSLPRPHEAQSVDVIRQKNRQLAELLAENESLRAQLAALREEALAQSPIVELEQERRRRLESEASAAKAAEILVEQNLKLTEERDTLETQLKETNAIAEGWKTDAKKVQDIQEIAMKAFERCNALQAENQELRQAIDAFAGGSTSNTVQQLQKVVANLTEEVMQYKKREGELKSKENQVRDKVNNSIIRAMRKQTRELKVNRTR